MSGDRALDELIASLRLPGAPAHGTARVGDFTVEYLAARPFASTVDLLFRQRTYDVEKLADPPLIIDGGAWLGLSVLRFRQLFPRARVIAFEPDPTIFEVLRGNLERNAVTDGVELVNAALTERSGQSDFTATGTDAGSLRCHVPGSAINVPTVRLSDVVTGPTALLKLNIEGAETEVVEELGDRLALVDQVLIEYHGFAELPQGLHRILAALDACGLTYIVSHFNERNKACVPPLRLYGDYRYFLLIYARRLGQPDGRQRHNGQF